MNSLWNLSHKNASRCNFLVKEEEIWQFCFAVVWGHNSWVISVWYDILHVTGTISI